MCCSVNQFSVCKAIALIVGIILGVAVGLLVGFFPVLLTNAITVLWIIFGITLLVFIFTAALSVYVTDGGAPQTIVKCFCPFGGFASVLSILTLALSVVLLWLPLAMMPVLTAVLAGFTVFFFTALSVGVICFITCVVRNICRG